MDMQGARLLAAPRDQVWAALNDPEVLRICIPGCQEVTRRSDHEFEALVTQKIGPISASFQGALLLSSVIPGESYTITGQGRGGGTASATGSADVRLSEVEGGTRFDYVVRAKVDGRLAQLGSRLIDGFAKRMADSFFDNFQLAVEGPIEPDAPADVTEEGAERKSGWFGRMIGKIG